MRKEQDLASQAGRNIIVGTYLKYTANFNAKTILVPIAEFFSTSLELLVRWLGFDVTGIATSKISKRIINSNKFIRAIKRHFKRIFQILI